MHRNHMLCYEIVESKMTLSLWIDRAAAMSRVEEVVRQFELHIGDISTQPDMPGSICYQVRQGDLPGVLSVTYWPLKQRLWVIVHEQQGIQWNVDILLPFAQALAQLFAGQAVLMNEEDARYRMGFVSERSAVLDAL